MSKQCSAVASAMVGLLWARSVRRDDRGGPRKPPEAHAGQLVKREHLAAEPIPVQLLGDPQRLRNAFQAGRTYETLLKGGLVCRLEDGLDWLGHAHLAYVFEVLAHRTIESNDGRRIVEVRHFENVSMVKLITGAPGTPNLEIDLGKPGRPVLKPLRPPQATTGFVELSPRLVGDAILSAGSRAAVDDQPSSACLRIDALSGKTIRMTYLDGLGVESIEPIGCALGPLHVEFLFHTSLAADSYFLSQSWGPSGKPRALDASHLGVFLDPSLHAVVEGRTRVRQSTEHAQDGIHLRICQRQDENVLQLRSVRPSRQMVGKLVLEGNLHSDPRGRYIQAANLSGTLCVQVLPQDSFLFGDVFGSQPEVALSYHCTLCSRRPP